ncbi:MAG: hypothetical protein SF029_22845 [bacterium]|nr:hypothetical protein [bacterium]
MLKHLFLLAIVVIIVIGAANAQEDSAASGEPALLSAYFGLDNALPRGANRLCRGAANQDGMPVIFSHVIDPDTLDEEDFAVTTESGLVTTPVCVTLDPATDTGELRTVLLIGEFGEADDDPPAQVEVVGEILSSEDQPRSFLETSVEVTPLSAGPFLVIAEQVPQEQWNLGRRGRNQQGSGCPEEGTVQIVRATWAGGISNREGDEAGEPEREAYRVTLEDGDGEETEITPFALADLGDGDNNHLLCLDVEGTPLSVFFPEGYLLDPNEDTLNPDTTVAVQPLR